MPIQPDSPMMMAVAVLLYLAFVNALTALLFRLDALRAEAEERRVPETTLHLIALAGGSLAAKLAQRSADFAPHSRSFGDTLNLIVAVQVGCIAILQTQKGQQMVATLGASTVQIAAALVRQAMPGMNG